jgi:hypothetical protein
MKCYYHPDRDAVGSCKACSKGLCPECAVDVGRGLACREQCESYVRALIALVDRNIKFAAGGAWLYSFLIILGLIFAIHGLLMYRTVDFGVVSGVCFIAWGTVGFIRSRKRQKEMR